MAEFPMNAWMVEDSRGCYVETVFATEHGAISKYLSNRLGVAIRAATDEEIMVAWAKHRGRFRAKVFPIQIARKK